jgi:hypothetical protein
MPAHIGIVAGSAEGAALCYRTICLEATALLATHAHPQVSLHGHSLADYMDGDKTRRQWMAPKPSVCWPPRCISLA